MPMWNKEWRDWIHVARWHDRVDKNEVVIAIKVIELLVVVVEEHHQW